MYRDLLKCSSLVIKIKFKFDAEDKLTSRCRQTVISHTFKPTGPNSRVIYHAVVESEACSFI